MEKLIYSIMCNTKKKYLFLFFLNKKQNLNFFWFNINLQFIFFYISFRINICSGAKEDRVLLSGLHTVCDLFCKSCHTILGWKYVRIYYFYYDYKKLIKIFYYIFFKLFK